MLAELLRARGHEPLPFAAAVRDLRAIKHPDEIEAVRAAGALVAVGAHEHPHLRHDNPEPLRPGMVVTIEPGFYVPGLGGFRHSDALLVTDDGAEPLTDFPRSLEELTLGS